MLEREIQAALCAHNRCTRYCNPLSLVLGSSQHSDELASAQSAGVLLDLKMHWHRLIAISKSSALVGERQRASPTDLRRCRLSAGQCIEAQRLDPEPCRLYDLKQDGACLRHLPRDRIHFRDDARNGC